MSGTTDRYINLFTDFGFKKLFGEEPNKDLLLSFLNSLLAGKEQVADLTYLKNERLGKDGGERRAVYDLYCSNGKGEKFIVEIQRVKQESFKERSLYYSTFALQEQALKGQKWNSGLKAFYIIALLDFEFSGQPDKFLHWVKLVEEETHLGFYDQLSFIYPEIPKFGKGPGELSNDYEKWLFAFKNLQRLREMPKELEEGVFGKLLELAEIARMKPRERAFYEDSLKDYWDLKSSMETYFNEGKAEGKTERNIEMALMMLSDNEPIEKVMRYTGLPEETVKRLKQGL